MPDSAFAYIDSKGGRRLPIHDEAHVRAALARFGQVVFESEEAMDRARTRLLRAAKKHGIVPVGFITGQLRSARQGRAGTDLPTGDLSLLMTDMEGSTALLALLGNGYANVLNEVRRLIRRSVNERGGKEVDARADETFAVFADPEAAVRAALDFQESIGKRRWPQNQRVRVRTGIHRGEVELTSEGYVGLPVNTVARVCSAAEGGQILITGVVRESLGRAEDLALVDLGRRSFAGLPGKQALFQVGGHGRSDGSKPLQPATGDDDAGQG